MAEEMPPVVGNWYKGEDEQLFKVIAVDEDDAMIEIQYFDGELDELDNDAWYELELERAAEPEDWTGPFDDLERDDLGYTDMNLRPAGRTDFLDELDLED